GHGKNRRAGNKRAGSTSPDGAMMAADILPFALPAGTTPLETVANDLLAGLDVESEPSRRVLAVLVVQLARTIDGSAQRGRASAAAMAAKELREAIAALQESAPAGEVVDPFATYRA